MVQIYIGDGKGKTTAVIGLAVRAAGWGKKVYIAQFLKNPDCKSGECAAIERYRLPIVIERFQGQTHPIFLSKDKFDRETLMRSISMALKNVQKRIKSKKFSVVILDEILNAYQGRFLSKRQLSKLLGSKLPHELVLTGRSAPSWLVQKADYVSCIQSIKHPFQRGKAARSGIEY